MTRRDVHPSDMFRDDPTLAAFSRDLQDAAAATPPPVVGASLSAVLEGRAPAVAHPGVRPPRRSPVLRSGRLRWVVAGAAFGLGAGSLGIAGALPDPVQRQVSRVADVIGVDLPDGSDTPDPAIPPAIVPPGPPATTESPSRGAGADRRAPRADEVAPGEPGRGDEIRDDRRDERGRPSTVPSTVPPAATTGGGTEREVDGEPGTRGGQVRELVEERVARTHSRR